MRRSCASDPASLYLGQTRNLLRDKHGLPSGFDSVRACMLLELGWVAMVPF